MKDQRAATSLKGKGNQEQFEFCQSMNEKFDQINESLAENDVNKAKTLLEEGKKLVAKRTKLIRLADMEDWGTVNEYMSRVCWVYGRRGHLQSLIFQTILLFQALLLN